MIESETTQELTQPIETQLIGEKEEILAEDNTENKETKNINLVKNSSYFLNLTFKTKNFTFPLSIGLTKIGRSESNDICILHKEISKNHACIELTCNDKGELTSCQLWDIGSLNKTRFNNLKLDKNFKQDLNVQDEFQLGLLKFKLVKFSEVESKEHEKNCLKFIDLLELNHTNGHITNTNGSNDSKNIKINNKQKSLFEIQNTLDENLATENLNGNHRSDDLNDQKYYTQDTEPEDESENDTQNRHDNLNETSLNEENYKNNLNDTSGTGFHLEMSQSFINQSNISTKEKFNSVLIPETIVNDEEIEEEEKKEVIKDDEIFKKPHEPSTETQKLDSVKTDALPISENLQQDTQVLTYTQVIVTNDVKENENNDDTSDPTVKDAMPVNNLSDYDQVKSDVKDKNQNIQTENSNIESTLKYTSNNDESIIINDDDEEELNSNSIKKDNSEENKEEIQSDIHLEPLQEKRRNRSAKSQIKATAAAQQNEENSKTDDNEVQTRSTRRSTRVSIAPKDIPVASVPEVIKATSRTKRVNVKNLKTETVQEIQNEQNDKILKAKNEEKNEIIEKIEEKSQGLEEKLVEDIKKDEKQTEAKVTRRTSLRVRTSVVHYNPVKEQPVVKKVKKADEEKPVAESETETETKQDNESNQEVKKTTKRRSVGAKLFQTNVDEDKEKNIKNRRRTIEISHAVSNRSKKEKDDNIIAEEREEDESENEQEKVSKKKRRSNVKKSERKSVSLNNQVDTYSYESTDETKVNKSKKASKIQVETTDAEEEKEKSTNKKIRKRKSTVQINVVEKTDESETPSTPKLFFQSKNRKTPSSSLANDSRYSKILLASSTPKVPSTNLTSSKMASSKKFRLHKAKSSSSDNLNNSSSSEDEEIIKKRKLKQSNLNHSELNVEKNETQMNEVNNSVQDDENNIKNEPKKKATGRRSIPTESKEENSGTKNKRLSLQPSTRPSPRSQRSTKNN